MANEPKTRPTGVPVADFLATVENPKRRADAQALDGLLTEITGERPVMWGPSIVGYGSRPGPTGEWPIVGFSPRKANLVLYGLGFPGQGELLARLGKHKTGAACLYLNKLEDIDLNVLRRIVEHSVTFARDGANRC